MNYTGDKVLKNEDGSNLHLTSAKEFEKLIIQAKEHQSTAVKLNVTDSQTPSRNNLRLASAADITVKNYKINWWSPYAGYGTTSLF